jgi:hypothetical protein
MRGNRNSNKTGGAFLLAGLCLLLAGCLDFQEEITVQPDGQVDLQVTVRGLDPAADPLVALPRDPDWQTSRPKDPDDPSRVILSARRTVSAGQPLPASFAQPADPLADQHLLFPTTVRTWAQDGITFFEFNRRYPARRMARFLGQVEFDSELERRILDQGIFAVSEEDRQRYLGLLTEQARQQYGSFLEEALGQLVLQGRLQLEDRSRILQEGRGRLHSILSPETVLEVLGQDEREMAVALEKVVGNIEEAFVQIAKEVKPGSGTGLQAQLHAVTGEYDLSVRLGNHQFAVTVNLPGTIISTNGQTDPEKPGTVVWEFAGEDLHDRGLELRAISALPQTEGGAHDEH